MLRILKYIKEYSKRGLLFSAPVVFIGGLFQKYYFDTGSDLLSLTVVFVLLGFLFFRYG